MSDQTVTPVSPTASELLALALRVEQATGLDRESDALVAACLRVGTEHAWSANYPTWEGRADGRVYLEKGGPSFAAPSYTASLDAAMTLMPDATASEGVFWKVGHDGEGADPCLFKATILVVTMFTSRKFEAIADKPALALTAASLRARAAQMEA